MRSSAHETYHSGSSKHADDTNNSGHPQKGIFGILDHDIVIWLGDLNYRLVKAVSLEEVYDKLKNGDINYLLKWDQLNRKGMKGGALSILKKDRSNLNLLQIYTRNQRF